MNKPGKGYKVDRNAKSKMITMRITNSLIYVGIFSVMFIALLFFDLNDTFLQYSILGLFCVLIISLFYAITRKPNCSICRAIMSKYENKELIDNKTVCTITYCCDKCKLYFYYKSISIDPGIK